MIPDQCDGGRPARAGREDAAGAAVARRRGSVETLVDNETAVQNLRQLAESGLRSIEVETISDAEYASPSPRGGGWSCRRRRRCLPLPGGAEKTVVISLGRPTWAKGEDSAELCSNVLVRSRSQGTLPAAILFYNGGAAVTYEELGLTLEDLQALQSQGVGSDLRHLPQLRPDRKAPASAR